MHEKHDIAFYIPPRKGLDTDFMGRGNCCRVNLPQRERVNMMYGRTSVEIKEAQKICEGCPVVDECLEYALTPPFEKWGVWGGKSEKERRQIRKRRSRTATLRVHGQHR